MLYYPPGCTARTKVPVAEEALRPDEVTLEAAPFVDVVADMVATGLGLGDTASPAHHPPAAGSPAEEAFRRQAEFASPGVELPVEGLNSAIVMTLMAAEDSMRAFVALMRSPGPPIYSHNSNVRTALECLGLVHNLADPSIDLEERVRRYLNYLIGQHSQRLFLPAGAIDKAGTKRRAAEIAGAAEVLNEDLGPKKRGIAYIGDMPPGQRALVAELLDPGKPGFGQAAYFVLSAKAHGGFINGLLANAVPLTEQKAGVHTVGIPRTSLDIAQCCAYLILGHNSAYAEYCIWTGRNAHPKRRQVEQQAQAALDAVKRTIDAKPATGGDRSD